MKKSGFFNRLHEEGKLQLVQPSEEITTYIDNSLISYAKKERIDKQYYVDFKIMKEEVEELIQAAEVFNSKILDFIEKLNSEKIAEFRIKMETLIKQV